MNDLFKAPDPDLTARDELLNKWKDKPLEEVLKAKIDADLHIKTVEKENSELRAQYLTQREELLTKAKFEEYLDRMEKTSGNDVKSFTPASDVESPKYDPKEVEALISNKIAQGITQSKILEKESENYNKVQTKLQEKFGDKFSTILEEQQNTLGLSKEDVNTLAKKSPEAFFRIMGLNEQRSDSFQAPPRSGQRNDNFAPRGEERRDMKYYEKLIGGDSRKYLDPKIANQMHTDAIALGDAFFG